MSMRLNGKLPPSFQSIVKPAFEALRQARVVDRLWAKDHRLWKPDPKEIADRLGWLTVQDQIRTTDRCTCTSVCRRRKEHEDQRCRATGNGRQ